MNSMCRTLTRSLCDRYTFVRGMTSCRLAPAAPPRRVMAALRAAAARARAAAAPPLPLLPYAPSVAGDDSRSCSCTVSSMAPVTMRVSPVQGRNWQPKMLARCSVDRARGVRWTSGWCQMMAWGQAG